MVRGASVLPIAAAAVLTFSGVQASEVRVYGQAHLAASHLDDGDDYSAFNLSSNASRIGFRVTHDFSDALRGMIQIEGQIDLDSNNNTSLTSRDSFGALMGDWGMLRVGHFDTPVKVVSRRVDLFGNQLGDSRNVVRNNYDGLQGFDERFRNSLAYRTPSFNGLTVDLHYSVETQNNNNAADDNDNSALSAAVSYLQGPVYVALGHERWSFENSDLERDITRLSAYYDVAAFRFTALAQTASDPDDNAYGLGVRYRLTPQVFLKAQYYMLDADDSDFDADMVAVGIDYRYVNNLTFYLNYAQISNDSVQTLAPWREASTLSQPGGEGDTARGVALGMIYSF
ncbi:MAG: porin [Ectothiorhodospiraceae bacterium]|nr:porin [Ectothiorhodospiraceae bacterium]MCH8504520.1 porin [Ectothiorhodospiraceae bacterium]